MTDERPKEATENIKAAYEKVRERWNGFTHWNYRVVRTVDPEGEVEYGVYECYWAEDRFISRTEEHAILTDRIVRERLKQHIYKDGMPRG
ncbi:MAG: hypothetical protein PHI12_11860 [Dehalococcoidales bacterium]|nr:hypothetical protein [Dehalococcoidales bacterium]